MVCSWLSKPYVSEKNDETYATILQINTICKEHGDSRRMSFGTRGLLLRIVFTVSLQGHVQLALCSISFVENLRYQEQVLFGSDVRWAVSIGPISMRRVSLADSKSFQKWRLAASTGKSPLAHGPIIVTLKASKRDRPYIPVLNACQS